MNGKIGNFFVAAVVVAAFAGTASAQNSTGTAAEPPFGNSCSPGVRGMSLIGL